MNDASLFTTGSLFTQDYLLDGVIPSKSYQTVHAADMRDRLDAIFEKFPHDSRPNEATTESDLIWPILEVLGWQDYLMQQNLSAKGRHNVPDGLLFIDDEAKAKANKFADESKRYQFGAAVIESKRWARALDRAAGSQGDDKDTPSTQLLRYLRRIDDLTDGGLRWGILTNGNKWRLYFSGARSTIDDYFELDLGRIMGLASDDPLLDQAIHQDERDHWLRVFIAMFSRDAFVRDPVTAMSFHDRARQEAALYEERVASNLSDKVFDTLYPMLGKAIAEQAPADSDLDAVRQATLILLYRLLFVLYAEDRALLPVKDSRYDDYALRVSRLDVGKRKDNKDAFSSVAKTIWNRFADLSMMIDKGDASVGLPPYNGGLFNAERTPLLLHIGLSDAVMADALDILSFELRDGQRNYINYRDLTVQQLGSIYERLLEFELIRDDAGQVDIRPNIFARKNSGSYYTPDDLVLLILDKTLKPLVDDALNNFQDALDNRDKKRPMDQQVHRLKQVDPAKAITHLRICDPAMGSGHFLVNLVDRLSNTALEAIAEAEVMAGDAGIENYESPLAKEIQDIRGTIYSNAVDNGWAVTDEQLDDPQLIKRMVLKRCVYGADKNPMAVELAKVSLWLHSFTVGAPLSFIDHHLATGDSLFGLWVRDAMDKAGQGGALFLHEPLQEAQRQARAMKVIEQISDADIGEAHESARLWDNIESATGPLDGFVSFMHALDWLAVGKKGDALKQQKALTSLWLDGRFGEPVPIARGKKAPDTGKAKAEEVEAFTLIWQEARALIEEENFLNWQVTFPGVWDNWTSATRQGGFDAVVGNPPWDRIKLQQVEWFAARRPDIAKAQRASDRKTMIAALKTADDPLYDGYIKANARAMDTLKIARQKPEQGGQYPLLSRGDINLYSLFVERAYALVKPMGMVGLLTPSGIASDLSASAFFRKIATGGHLQALYDFENKKIFFPDVHASFKFCVMSFSPARQFAQSHCAFYLHSIKSLANPDQCFPISADDFARVNPNTGTAPIFRTRRDMQLTTAIYARVPVLVDRSTDKEVKSWPVKYSTMFHMANDSHLFRTRAELEEQEGAWPIGGNRWQSKDGEWLPLYEGKMVQAYDHRAADIVINSNNLSRPGQQEPISIEEHKDIDRLPVPRYWLSASKAEWLQTEGAIIGFKDITSATNMRTMIAAAIPNSPAGHKLPFLFVLGELQKNSFQLLANLNAIIFDYISRQKLNNISFILSTLEQLPVIPPAAYDRQFGPKSAGDIVRAAVLELTYTAHDMADFARDMGHVDANGDVLPPFIWDEERRLHLRARLDALYFILYGVYNADNVQQSRDDIRYIYSTFPIVERKETAQYGHYRSRELCLSYINTLMAGQPDAVVEG